MLEGLKESLCEFSIADKSISFFFCSICFVSCIMYMETDYGHYEEVHRNQLGELAEQYARMESAGSDDERL